MRTPSSQKCRLDLAPPLADRFILGLPPSIAARHFSSCPSDSTLRWTPCPPEYGKQRLQVRLGCIQLSLSCPFRRLHTFCFLWPARLLPPAFGNGAPHLSAKGTLTLQNNALLSAHSRSADSVSFVQQLSHFTRRHPQDLFSREIDFYRGGVLTERFPFRCCRRSAGD